MLQNSISSKRIVDTYCQPGYAKNGSKFIASRVLRPRTTEQGTVHAYIDN